MIARIRTGLARARVVHFDETGFFVAQQHWWLPVSGTDALAFYTAHPRRGGRAHDAIGLLPTTGTALHDAGEAAEPPPTPGANRGPPRRTPGARLLRRLRRHRDAVLRFVHDLAVPFDNSEAERDLRMMKVEQKVSGGFRTAPGAHPFCTLRSYLVTARKQGVDVLGVLRGALTGTPFIPAVP